MQSISLRNTGVEQQRERRRDEPGRYHTPVRQLWQLLNRHPWRGRSRELAYICACFSELSYLHLTQRELDRPGRYKWVPSLAFQKLAANGASFDVRSAANLDFPVFLLETRNFVYAGFAAGRTAVVAIRGTKSPADILIDLMTWKRVDLATGQRVHFGFAQEAEAATPLLIEHLSSLPHVREVAFTGHSLGGALAGVLHARWRSLRTPLNSITPYVFGTPRFTEAAAMQLAPVHAYRKPNDYVPHLPPRILGYEDAGPFPVPVPEGTAAWPSGWRVLGAWLSGNEGRGIIRPHAIELYRRQLGVALAPNFPDLVYWEYAQAIMRETPPPTYAKPGGAA